MDFSSSSISPFLFAAYTLMGHGQVVALQAPVSDRESLGLTPGDHSAHLTYARSLVSQLKGEEMMPRSAFWAPITASRYLSLFGMGGTMISSARISRTKSCGKGWVMWVR